MEHDILLQCDCGAEVLAIDFIDFDDSDGEVVFSLFKDWESSIWERIKGAFKILNVGRLYAGEVCLPRAHVVELIKRLEDKL